MVVLGLDWGQSRIGAAVSDELGIAAHFADTIIRDGQEQIILQRYLDRHAADRRPEG